jgi:hypothetical protein
MAKSIKIFKSFEDQEMYQLEEMRNTTPLERFKRLFHMQQLTKLFHPTTNTSRRIIIQRNGFIN